MNSNGANQGEQLILRSQMSELAQVPTWIERLAVRDSIPNDTQFAIDLCLEEVLSNIVRHGYAGNPDHTIIIQYAKLPDNSINFVIEDEAPPFNPLEAKEPEAAPSLEELQPGGQGIHLVRQFAQSLKYESKSNGNRLSIGFAAS